MMKRPIVSFVGRVGALIALCALPGHDAYGRHLQPEEALSMMRTGAMRSASAAQLRLAYTQKSAASVSTVYVFDREGAPGFYVLAADDAVGNIVLGYSHSGSFSADNMAPGMKWLLNAYSAQVSCCAESASPVASKAAPAGLQAVAPLLSTKWSQQEPYNDLCPTYGDERAVTGCVATAMAQVMNKHRWPASGTGESSYVSNGVGVSSDFSSHVYDWDNMLDEYHDEYYQLVGTPAQREAVARLMFDCGVAAKTVYSPNGSSANSMNAATGMLNYFNYDKSMQYLMRDWYTDDDWMRLMHSQISQGLPVIYGGDSNEGYGHEFILDGYDGEGYFHFNWGWGGWDDGYFSLAFDVPAGEDIEYVNYQEALVNILPDKGSSYAPLMILGGSLLTDATQYEAQSGYVSFTTDGQYVGFFSYALGDMAYEWGVKNTLDDKVISVGSYQLSTYYGYGSISAASAEFPVGEYDVYMVYKSPDTDWTPMRYDVNGCTGSLHFINDGTTITVGESASDVVATGIVLNAVEQQLTEGDTFTLIATVSPENATNKTVTWSTSDAAVATVDAEGKVTAVAPGIATITATCGNVSATCAVTVVKRIISPTGVALNTEAVELTEGDSYQLVATVSPENTTDKTVIWSTSDAAVATVDAEGKVTAIAAGIVNITASCGNVSATCAVTVVKRIISPTGVALNTEAVELTEGDSYRLVATVSPETATDKTITWSTSDAAVATVDAEGKVTAVAPGTATITATCGNVSATCAVTVLKRIVAATGVALNVEAVELIEGDSYQLVATVSPEATTDKTITWSTSDAAIATVDAEGKVTAVAAGIVNITASCGNVSATCAVTVLKRIVAATGVTLNAETVELTEGDSYQLIATVSPETTTDKTVTWSTSDAAVATVDAEGKVTAVAPGMATITATCGNVSATCAVTVVKRIISPTGVALNTEAVELTEGDSYQLVATVSPETATDKTVTWSTSDAAVATVDAEGKVTAVAPGTATIIATCGNVSATCAVTVVKRIIAAESIVLNAGTIDLVEGDSYQLIATVLPENATDKTITWSTSDAAVATVDADGMVTAIADGTATITVTCGSVSANCVVAVRKIDAIWSVCADGVSIRVADGNIRIEAPEDAQVAVYDAAGTLYYIGYDRTIPVAGNKLYIVVVGSKTFKVKV